MGDAASSRVPPAAATPRRRGALRVFLAWLLALAAIAAGVWWTFHFPFDPQAIYCAIPARAAATLRVLDLPERWESLVANPLVASALRTAGVPQENIWIHPACTCCTKKNGSFIYGSNRRETSENGEPDAFTVQAAFIKSI